MNADRAQVDRPSAPAVPEPPAPADAPPSASTATFAADDTALTRVPAPAVSTLFGRYELRRLLGRGGMGEVHLAFDTTLQRVVALKIPKFADDHPVQRERFLREARAAALLSHPNICPVHDVGEVDQRPYLTMTYVDGPSLADRLKQEGPLPAETAARLVRAVALAMHHAHGQGILHRDLKPGNILVNAQGEPVVMDFGLAFRFDAETSDRLTEQGLVVGTPSYMPPEQINGQALSPASDVYSLGVVLYELTTGRVPFEGPLGKLLAQIQATPPPPPTEIRPDLPVDLETICLRALAKRPEERFADMAALADALTDYLEGRALARGTGEPTIAFRRPARRPWVLVVAAAALVALGIAAVVPLLRTEPPATDNGEPAVPRSQAEIRRDQLRAFFAAMDSPVLKIDTVLPGDRAVRVSRASVPDAVLKDHGGGLYFMLTGSGFGHVLDLTDRAGQAGQVTNFGPGDLTILEPYLFFLGNVREEARFYLRGRLPLSVLAPMNGGKGSDHVEFDGTHLLQPKVMEAQVTLAEASPQELARLRNPALTKKVAWYYPETKYVIYARPDVAVVPGNHEKRRELFPDVYNLIEYDRQRQTVARTVRLPALFDLGKAKPK